MDHEIFWEACSQSKSVMLSLPRTLEFAGGSFHASGKAMARQQVTYLLNQIDHAKQSFSLLELNC